jgi:hypothetical protein
MEVAGAAQIGMVDDRVLGIARTAFELVGDDGGLTPSRASRSICRICRVVSSLLAGIRFPSLINEGLDARGTDPNENADSPQKAGRKLIGIPAGFKSERWLALRRNTRPE